MFSAFPGSEIHKYDLEDNIVSAGNSLCRTGFTRIARYLVCGGTSVV